VLTHYVKVVISRKTIYLEGAKYFNAKGIVFLSGYQVTQQCEPVSMKGDTMHCISVGTKTSEPMPLFKPFEGIKIYQCEVSRMYGELVRGRRIQ
jgi:hypothetical protein